MQFSTIFTVLAAASVAVAAPSWGSENNTAQQSNAGSCAAGTIQCCDTIYHGASAQKQLSLLGLDTIAGAVGAECIPINAIGAAVQDQCKSAPVCCQNTKGNGIAVGCNTLPIV